MKRADPLLTSTGADNYWHWCPACERLHPLPSRWQFNENFGRPTFTPSFKQTFARLADADIVMSSSYSEVACGDAALLSAGKKLEHVVCHYFITDGKIQFCADSWHGRSDIVAMPPIPVDKGEDFA